MVLETIKFENLLSLLLVKNDGASPEDQADAATDPTMAAIMGYIKDKIHHTCIEPTSLRCKDLGWLKNLYTY